MRRLPLLPTLALASALLVSDASANASTSLSAALDSIRADRIRADIEYVACDDMGGRDTPSRGLRLTARFLRNRLDRLGFEPGGPDGWFYEYPLGTTQIDVARTSATVHRDGEAQDLEFGTDYYVYASRLSEGTADGEVVFVGEGTRTQFKELDVTGRWALCLDSKMSWRQRERAARDAGAVGLILTPGPEYDGQPYARRFKGQVERAREPMVHWPREEPFDRGEVPVVWIDGTVIESLVPGFGGGRAIPIGYDVGARFVERRALAGGGRVMLENVCGLWPGSDPRLSNEVIIVSAHYDHIGERANGTVYNGADDNGSGTCGLLALAEALSVHGPMRRSVLLMWVSGEEKGLWGSQAWTEDPFLPGGRHAICNLNIDMIGRNAPDQLLVTPTSSRPEYNGLVRALEGFAREEGFGELGSADEYWSRSDHHNFAKNMGLPVAFLFSDVHEDYHQPGDTADKVDADKVRRVTRLVLRTIAELQGDELGF